MTLMQRLRVSGSCAARDGRGVLGMVESVALAVFAMVVLLAMVNGAAGLIGGGGGDAVAQRTGAVANAGGVSGEDADVDGDVSGSGAVEDAAAVIDDAGDVVDAGGVAGQETVASGVVPPAADAGALVGVSGVVVPDGWVPAGVGGGCLPGGGSVCVAAEAVLGSAAPRVFVDASAGPAVRSAAAGVIAEFAAASGVAVSVTDDRSLADVVVQGADRVELDGSRVWGKTECSGAVVGALCTAKTVTLDAGIDAGRAAALLGHEAGHALGLAHADDVNSPMNVEAWNSALTAREAQQLRLAYASVFPEVYAPDRTVVSAWVPKPFDVGLFGSSATVDQIGFPQNPGEMFGVPEVSR